jgi:hypothetical protein
MFTASSLTGVRRMLTAIPCVLMRGGTSRGAFFHADDLPRDRDTLAEVLVAALGAGHPLQIDGLGGGAMVTSKVAIVAPSSTGRTDIDYLFAQVLVETRHVDFTPTCGNMLAGVGPFAIEAGLVAARDGETPVPHSNGQPRCFDGTPQKVPATSVSVQNGHGAGHRKP